jgi:hypothetical protein
MTFASDSSRSASLEAGTEISSTSLDGFDDDKEEEEELAFEGFGRSAKVVI